MDGSNPDSRRLWARTKLLVHPELYQLVSLPFARLSDVVQLIGESRGAFSFSAVLVERTEVSLVTPSDLWTRHRARFPEARSVGLQRVVTFDLEVNPAVSGFFAPAAVRLATARIGIVPLCAFSRDHVLVQEHDLARAVEILEAWIHDCSLERLSF